MQNVDQGTRQDEPINLSLFYKLLQDHDHGSVKCKGADSVMLFGSTGVGKSTMLHLLAGAELGYETVEVESELGGVIINQHLRSQMEIPGCAIGHSAASTTMLLSSHHDSSTGLTYIDTPGFNNVSGDDDTTIDAANSAAIMSTIRSCRTLRVVFLISVKDELDATKAGQIKRLFELMGKFILNPESHMPSVLMLFTHCAGFNANDVIDMLKRILASPGGFPAHLKPFLLHAHSLLQTHQDVLLIAPAAEDGQQRMNQVRNLLKGTVVPIVDTEAALQCPLPREVLMSLENRCRSEEKQIVQILLQNRLLNDSRRHLDHLRLLNKALRLPAVKDIYQSALNQMVSLAEDRKKEVLKNLQRQSFSQVRSSLSIWGFKFEVDILSSHMSIIDRPRDELKTLHDDCISAIISTCEKYDHNLDKNLETDDFDAAVMVLTHCKGMLEHLKEYLPTKRREMVSCGALKKVRARTIGNKEKARALIHDKQFDAELCRLLDTIRRSSEAEWPAINHDQITINETDCRIEEDYGVVSAEMNTRLTNIAEELNFFFKPDSDVSTNIIIQAFMDDENSTADALSQIDSAYHLCSPHIRDDTKRAREACHEALSGLKDTSFERLRDAIGNFEWKEASSLFDCMERAGKLGSQEEMRTVESRLEDIKESAKLNLSTLVECLSSDLDCDDFRSFSRREISLRNAISLPADSGLGKALLLNSGPQQEYHPEVQQTDKQRRQRMFKSDYDLLLSKVNDKFTQAVSECKTSLKDLDLSKIKIFEQNKDPFRIRMLDKMAEALSVGREPESGCLVLDFNKRLAELLQHVRSDVVDKCKSLVAPRHDPLQYSTESEVKLIVAQLQPVHQLRKHVFTLKSQIPSLCMIMSLDTSDLIPHSTAAEWDEELFRMLQDAEDHLCRSLQSYARACHDRCLSSLAAEPKPLADDIVNFLNTLTNCQILDPYLASVGPDEGAGGTQPLGPFAEQRKSVRDAVKQKFTEVRDSFSRDVRAADRMAAAQANLEWVNEMQPLRDEFKGDAITLDAHLQEMKGSFEQNAGTFARKFDYALSQERFPDMKKLLVGSRDLRGAVEQEEYNIALNKLIDTGDKNYKDAIEIISMIMGRSDLPPSVKDLPASLRWIESSRELSLGEDPILPVKKILEWQDAFNRMTLRLELLVGETETKLDEWMFATVEEIHRRLVQLLMLRFPVEIAGTIEKMQSDLSAALDAKVAGLNDDVRNALEKGEYTEFDHIFQQVQIAKDAESSFVKRKTYTSVHGVMEHFLNDVVESIKGHYMNLEIKEAYSKHQQLRNLKRSQVVKTHVEDTGLDTLAEQKKKSMITRSWLSEGDVHVVKKKVNGFRDVDVGNYEKLVCEFIESFKADTTRLAKVESKRAVLEVRDLVRQIPRFAEFLDDQMSALKTGWDDIWSSFFESVDRNVRLAIAAGQGHDISDSRSFLEEARKLLQQHATGQWPKAGRNKAKRASTGGKSKGPGVHENNEHGRGGVTGEGGQAAPSPGVSVVAALGFVTTPGCPGLLTPHTCTALFDSLTPGGGIGHDANAGDDDDFFDAEEDFEEQKRAFSLPFENVQVERLMKRLDIVLGQMEVDTDQIGADWAQHVENFDCKAEGRSFVQTLNFMRQLKRQAQAIRTGGEYGITGRAMPTPEKAVRRVFASVAERIRALDASKPEECAVLWQNLNQFGTECRNVVDDDVELEEHISHMIKSSCQEVREWVLAVTKDFTEKSTERYRQAQLEHSPDKRKALLHEVQQGIDQHQLLEEKLVERKLIPTNGTASPLVAEIKSEISGKTERTRQALTRNYRVEDVAISIHEIYEAAMDLGNTAIFNHSNDCIASILQDCRGQDGMGLTDLGNVLERDLPRGGEIVANQPHFTELNLLAFQRMTTGGRSVEGTVNEVARLNNLSESQKQTLLQLVEEVFAEYDTILKAFHHDIPKIVRDIKIQYETHRRIPALIGGVFAVWSLESKTEHCRTPRRPLPAQVVAIVRLLALDDQHALDKIRRKLPRIGSILEWWFKSDENRFDASHLAQIKTGQGKSVVLGALSTVLSIAGFSVDCVCYSAYLSERDALDFKGVFGLFGVSHMVKYGTFQQLSERLVNSEGDVREMTRDLIMSSNKGRDASTSNPSGAKGEQKKRILLVDEVDVFFSRSFYGETYDPVVYLKIPEITDLQERAWSMKGDTKRILPALKAMDVYQTLMNNFPDVKEILEKQINIMIRDLEAWQKKGDSTEHFRAYKIMDEKVAYKSGVCYNNKITFGYVTLWTYFHEVDCNRLPKSALEDHLGVMIKCGQFSYAEIPKRYNLILGVTGTLAPEKRGGQHPLGTFEREIVRHDYSIKGMTELPSIYGDGNLTFREYEHVSVEKDEDSYNNAISREVAKAKKDRRAVLVFFESEAKLEEWQNSTYGQLASVPKGTLECIKSDTRDITLKVRKATHSGQVTLLSREHGRGLDFDCKDKTVDELGGLHVVQTFLSEELSEEIQIRGRTARQSKRGSFQMILLAKDLEKFEISDDEIEEKKKGLYVRVAGECNICMEHFSHGDEISKLTCKHEFHTKCVEEWLSAGNSTCPSCRRDINAPAAAATATSGATTQTMYEFLHEKRAVFLDKSSTTRREVVQSAKAMHDQSAAFQRELLAYSQAPTQSLKDKCLPFLRGRNIVQTSQSYHVVFVLDESGSMSGQPWTDLKAAVRSFLEIREGESTADIISLILFDTGARSVCKATPLADLQPKLEAFLKMKGGGTLFGPALKEALNVIGDVHHQIGYPPLVMLMSDGGSTDGEPEMKALRTAFPNVGLQVKTMGFGSGCDSTKLQTLATLGGGDFSLALNGLELKECFEQAAVSLSYRS